jgi:proline dehydrogenase
MGIARKLLLKGAESRWLATHLPNYPFARRAVRRFMPGERSEDALGECQALEARGIRTVITRLGENIARVEDASAVTMHYQDVLNNIRQRNLPTHISVKLTQLGMDVDHSFALKSVRTLMEAAAAEPVWIDMEGSRYTKATIDLFNCAREHGSNVGLCVQAYLRRTNDDLDGLLATTTALRLVKGAYQEPAGIAFEKKSDVDANYIACARRLLLHTKHGVVGHVPAFATHDVAIIRHIAELAEQEGIARDRYEFQLLYGINSEEQRRLAREGFRVRVLISYGEAWFAWYMRRLAERPANVLFLVRNLF